MIRRIIAAAIQIISEKGVKKISLAEIAREAGLSKGTLYYYFPSKNDLIFDIADIHMEKITREIFALIDTRHGKVTLEELLTVLFKSLLFSEQRGRLHLYLIREAIGGNSVLQRRFRKTYYQWFSMMNEACMKTGIKVDDYNVKARLLVAVLDGLVIQVLLNMEQPTIEPVVNRVMKLIDI